MVIYMCYCYFQVGAGLPVIASVTRIIASGDPVSRIVGSLSGMQLLVYYVKKYALFLKKLTSFPSYGFVGTLGYVMSELEDGKRFSEVVKTAKSLGFTEPGLAISH
jgi:homoserine dehydrogenase